MRFLFECVSCYRGDPTCPDSATVEHPPLTPTADDQSRSLFSRASTSADSGSERVQRKKSRSANGGVEWKPSLHAISEDITLTTAKAKAERDRKVDNNSRKSGSGKRCAVSSTPPVVRQRVRSDYYGHESLPMIVPALAPTPFMF